MNVVAWILDALKVWPEPAQLPESLDGATPQQLAEARSRLQQISQVTTELRRLVDAELARALTGSAMRYGDTVLRPSGGRGDTYVKDGSAWWEVVIKGLQASPRPVELIEALFPLKVKVTGIPMLAAALGEDADELRMQHIANEETDTPLEVKPIFKAAKFLQVLEEGEIRKVNRGNLA